MAFIPTTPVKDAIGDVRELYERQQGPYGYVPNYAKVFCYRPALMKAWANLQACIRQTLDPKSFELVTLAAAQAIGSSYCSLAHAKVLIQRFYSETELRAIVCDEVPSPLSDPEKAMMRVARKVALDPSSVTANDMKALRALGISDEEIFDIVAAAAARCFFSKLADGLGAEPDAAFLDIEPTLRKVLTVGRPIAEDAPESLD